jgi:hypothetical protein
MRPQGISFPTVSGGVSRGHFAGNHFVDVAPDPFFSGLDRAHHGMAGVMEMFGGMLVLRRIAATHIPADHAHPEMNPSVPKFDALCTNVNVGRPELDLIQVFAFLSHRHLPQFVIPQFVILNFVIPNVVIPNRRSSPVRNLLLATLLILSS